MAPDVETSKPALSDTLLQVRLHLLNPLLETKSFMPEAVGNNAAAQPPHGLSQELICFLCLCVLFFGPRGLPLLL